MAKAEANLIYKHPEVQNVNQHLLSIMEGRSLEGIKGKRRDACYKRIVNDLLISLRDQSIINDPISPPSQNEFNLTVEMPVLSPAPENILHESFEVMPVLVSSDTLEGSIDFYLKKLYNDRSLGGTPTEQELIIDEALRTLNYDPLRARDLIEEVPQYDLM